VKRGLLAPRIVAWFLILLGVGSGAEMVYNWSTGTGCLNLEPLFIPLGVGLPRYSEVCRKVVLCGALLMGILVTCVLGTAFCFPERHVTWPRANFHYSTHGPFFVGYQIAGILSAIAIYRVLVRAEVRQAFGEPKADLAKP